MDENHRSRTPNVETVPALGVREVQVFDLDQTNMQALSDHQIRSSFYLPTLAQVDDGANAAHVGFSSGQSSVAWLAKRDRRAVRGLCRRGKGSKERRLTLWKGNRGQLVEWDVLARARGGFSR